MIIIHHSKDLDGYSSGAICKLKYPDATLIGWDYKDPIPWNDIPWNEPVIMIDVTFPMETMLKLSSKTDGQLTVIDHHISFKKDFDAAPNEWEKSRINYIYEPDVAACEIGWKYLFPDKPIPYAITLLGRYDTWRQNEGDWENETLPFQYAMRTYCTSAETFDKSLLTLSDTKTIINSLKNEGRAILNYQEQQDMLACQRSAFEAIVSERPAICLNTRAFSSNTMKSVYDPSKHDLMVGFEYTGTKWSVSLRSDKPDVDVSIIAKSKGGGGHKAAAGFECNTFEEIFK
jgi:oligoribonuclease NrnB/cAMP/cGMP phosphodiesterase (DHH superfamily)